MSWLKRTSILALTLALLVTFVACAADDTEPVDGEEPIGTVSVMGVWGAGEIEPFEEVVAAWEADTGGTMEFEGTRDLSAILRARVSGGNPPDLAILPNPALLQDFAGAGDLIALDDVLDMGALGDDYADTWIDLGTVDGDLYGVFIKAATKSTVWYNPANFNAAGYEIPESWDDMIALSDQMVADGTAPWSIGIESGGATGWPGTDWIQEILLAESGPDVYDQWVAHEISWTDPAIKSAFEKFGEVALAEGYVPGGADAILATPFQDASYLPFQDPPQAHMYFLGAFTQGFIAGQFPDLVPEDDYDFFKFPYVDAAYMGAVTGGADVVVMLNDTPSARSLMRHLATADAWESWAAAGGYSSPNRSLDVSVYPDALAAKAAEQLTESAIFRFDADDLMPSEVQNAYFAGIIDYLQQPDRLDAILGEIEAVAAEAYAQ
ncbi:MAG: carbohydrate ABC transporter substrate-binding protein [Coriobacteriia bacterium]|nr:carbohydrate ABC transporter substrate-binding protein [Coriobacteriia bacterium]